ncbi:hypothetical protein UFOVP257_81 [uncultured Caudovirales phage]|uniref:Uncharacterized protein n=1 Tax=uncultured Caudovirales phage TaxID=2100421 RepID=A0A6J5LJI2_9CAUD|nr:hypothetical protein UFOVP257_81 [uncultured Caudovirales phage]
MITYKHSGTAGDTIYSLDIVRKMGGGHFAIAIGNIENCIMQYTGRPADVAPEHVGRYTEQDYAMLAPLIARQSYITNVQKWYSGYAEPDVDLDHFRSFLYRKFEGNIIEAYHKAFDLPWDNTMYSDVWLEADPIKEASIVVNRTNRYLDTSSIATWQTMADDAKLEQNGIFVGLPSEHEEFVRITGCNIKYRPVKDFKELADVIAGADLFLGNQSMAYSIATGLGKDTMLEIHKIKSLQYSECYFPREGASYF